MKSTSALGEDVDSDPNVIRYNSKNPDSADLNIEKKLIFV